jgi:type VI secretion system protein ImpK
MIKSIYWVCADAIALAAQLGEAQELPKPEVLRQRINVLFSEMAQKGRQIGVSDVDLRDVTYAISAFMDEQLLRSSWTERQVWLAQPLQLAYFNENTAGEGFFQRLQILAGTPGKEHLVQIYYLCMALGFRGRYSVPGAGGDIKGEQDYARNVVSAKLLQDQVLSPSGISRAGVVAGSKRRWPVAKLGAGLCLVCIVIFAILKTVILSNASSAAEEIRQVASVTQSQS